MLSLLLATLVCFGDSVTAGVGVPMGSPTFCDSLHGINAGVPSNDTAEALARFDTDVLSNNPNIVLIMFGLNDSLSLTPDQYKANLKIMIRKLKRKGIKPILLTPNYTNRPWWNPSIEPYVKAMRRLARGQRVPLIDVWQGFKNHPAIHTLLDADAAHPNELGHNLIFKLITERLKRF